MLVVGNFAAAEETMELLWRIADVSGGTGLWDFTWPNRWSDMATLEGTGGTVRSSAGSGSGRGGTPTQRTLPSEKHSMVPPACLAWESGHINLGRAVGLVLDDSTVIWLGIEGGE